MAKKVFLAIPCHSGDISVGTHVAVSSAIAEAVLRGVTVLENVWSNDSLIPNARNIQLATFLTTDCTDMVFVDSDIRFDVDDFFRLLSHPVDIVGGAYRFKRDDEDYPVCWLPDPDGKGLWSHPLTGLIEVEGVPTGFMRITRLAAEKLTEAHPDDWYHSRMAPDLKIHNLFDLVVENHGLRGEDYGFCKKWRALGGEVWLDPYLKIDHIGKTSFKGDVGRWLLNRENPPSPEDTLKKLDTLRQSLDTPEMRKLFDDASGVAA